MAGTTVADVVVDGLQRAGVRRLFAADAPHAALDAAASRAGLDVIRAVTPSAALVMAAVAAELSDAPGVVVTDRPVDPAYAVRSRAPVIVLVAAPEPAIGDVKGIVAVEPASAAHWIAHAARLALRHPRGPVQLVLRPDAAGEPTLPVATAVRPAATPPDARALDAAAAAIVGATRPVVVVGLESRWPTDAPWVLPFAETLPAPVVATPKAKGVLPDAHPLAFGLLGSPASRAVLDRADLVVALGVDAIEIEAGRWPHPRSTLAIAAGESVAADRVVASTVGLVLEELAPRLRSGRRADWDVAELVRLKGRATAPSSRPTAAARVVAVARGMTPPGAIAVVESRLDIGDVAAAWVATAANEFFADAGDGFAAAAVLAAARERPDRTVLCVYPPHGTPPSAALAPNLVAVVLPPRAAVVGGTPALRAALEGALVPG
jgi:acetolactate synthase-1/2/3 large subunit